MPDNGQPCLTPRWGEKKVWGMTVIENTASNIIKESFYRILNLVAEIE